MNEYANDVSFFIEKLAERKTREKVKHMHFAIIEDFPSDQQRLMELIRSDCAVRKQQADFSCFDSGEAFLDAYHPGRYDALFVDILLGAGISGLEAARCVRRQEAALPIIFTTTEPDFALDSYQIHALDYLIKPLDPVKMSWCLNLLQEYLSSSARVELAVIDKERHSRLCAVTLDNILYAQSQNHVLAVCTTDGLFRTRMNFHHFLDLLPHTGRFFICGRGVIVNLSQVEAVGDGVLLLKNGERLLFTRGKQEEVKKAFVDWSFRRSRTGGWT